MTPERLAHIERLIKSPPSVALPADMLLELVDALRELMAPAPVAAVISLPPAEPMPAAAKEEVVTIEPEVVTIKKPIAEPHHVGASDEKPTPPESPTAKRKGKR